MTASNNNNNNNAGTRRCWIEWCRIQINLLVHRLLLFGLTYYCRMQSKGSKYKVIVESTTGSQEKCKATREEYANRINQGGDCILFAVFRGKRSVGVSLMDDNACCCIFYLCGPSFPTLVLIRWIATSKQAKKAYKDEQQTFRQTTPLLPAAEWYSLSRPTTVRLPKH
jgi:hypothetical protein